MSAASRARAHPSTPTAAPRPRGSARARGSTGRRNGAAPGPRATAARSRSPAGPPACRPRRREPARCRRAPRGTRRTRRQGRRRGRCRTPRSACLLRRPPRPGAGRPRDAAARPYHRQAAPRPTLCWLHATPPCALTRPILAEPLRNPNGAWPKRLIPHGKLVTCRIKVKSTIPNGCVLHQSPHACTVSAGITVKSRQAPLNAVIPVSVLT
jgi:hypothetical protein